MDDLDREACPPEHSFQTWSRAAEEKDHEVDVTCVTYTLDGVYMYARTYEEAYDHHLLPARYS
jgi:hypothetical protein